MERENAGIGEVINAVESASAAELKELALIRKTVESLKDNPRVPRSVAASAREIEQAKNEDAPATADEIAAAMKQLNLGQAPAIRTPSEKASVIPTPAAPQSPPAPKPSTQAEPAQRRASDASKESITPAKRIEAATQARQIFNHAAGGQAQPKTGARDARGRFIGGAGSKAASDEAKAERREKARHQDEMDEQAERDSFLKKLVKAAGEIDNPSETRAADAVGYAVGGPLWAIGKELGGITKEVGGTVNNARKSMAEVFKSKSDDNPRRGWFGRRSKNSADVVQLNTQKRTVEELSEQTDAIREGDQKIIDRLDKIAGNTGKKGGGVISKLFNLLGKGGGGLVKILGGLLGGGLLKKVFGRGLLRAGGRGIGKLGTMALGGFGLNKITRSLFGGGARAAAGAATEAAGGAIATRGLSRLGLKALGKGALRAIPIVGTLAGALYDSVTGWNDTDAQRKAFGLKEGQGPSFQQKSAYTAANVMDMGGLVSGISSALGSVLENMGFTDIGKMLQFSTDDMARMIDSYWTGLENSFSDLGKTISNTFTEYTDKIGLTVSGWFSGIKDDLIKKLNDIVKFFTLDNIGKIFKDAIGETLEFLKHPVESIKKKADQVVDTTKEKAKEAWASVKNGAKGAYHWLAGDDKKPGAVEKGVEKAKDVAKSAGKEVAKATDAILNSKAGEMAKQGAQKLHDSIGQTASSVTNTARASSTSDSAYEIDKQRFNGGKDAKIPALNSAGKKFLSDHSDYFAQLERQYGLENGTLSAVSAAESGGGQRLTNNESSALGPFQILKGTRGDLGLTDADAMDPVKSAEAAARYLNQLIKRYNGDQGKAIAAYHAGMGNIDKGKLAADTGEYVTRVRGYQEQINKGAIFGSKVDDSGPQLSPSSPSTPNASVDKDTGLTFAPADSPFKVGGLVDKIGKKAGIEDLVSKFMNSRGMRHEVVQGTLADRAYGMGTTTTMGNVRPEAVQLPTPVQQPTARIQLDGRTISDLGGSGAKPTMQLADNTVSLDKETKRIFKRMTDLLDSIEGHTKEAAKQKGTTVKVSTPQPGVMSSVPLSINDPLMNDYARVD